MRIVIKIVFCIICFCFCHFRVLGQTKEQKQADDYFSDKNYQKAMRMYQKIAKKEKSSFYVCRQIGDCYRYLNMHDKAIVWYLKAIEYPGADKETYLLLSREYTWFENYNDADKYIQEYNRMVNNMGDSVLVCYEKIIPQLKKDSSSFLIKNMDIVNSENSDIGPTVYMNNIVFASDRKVFSPINRTDVREGTHFYHLYISNRKNAYAFSKPELFDKNLTSSYNDGPVTFNDNFTKAFLTTNYKTKHNTYRDLNVFVSIKKDGSWSNDLVPIFVTHNDCSYMHAFLTSDNKRLFFVSDKPGGYGGYDIYYSNITDGFLSTPVNLGPEVNTCFNEIFPYVSADSTLYFSSDRPMGLGGLDIYFAKTGENGYSKATNIGYPLNSSKDDFGLVMLGDNCSGYFVSNRPGGIGNDDIYAFRMKELERKVVSKIEVHKEEVKKVDESDIQDYYGEIGDMETGDPISDADVILYDNTDEVVRLKTDKEGKFSFSCKKNGVYSLEVKKDHYLTEISDLENLVDLNKNDNAIFVFLKKY